MARDQDRRIDARPGIRCQLFIHDDNQHVAMVDADLAAPFDTKWQF
jgi:hypothetical protein